MTILKMQYQVDASLIYYLPFLEEFIDDEHVNTWKTFEEREGFVFIGNFLHEPNWNTLQIIKTQVWPGIRKRLPTAKMHVYGAYPAQKVMQLHNGKENFLIHGRAKDALEVMAKHKVLLAPIQFGAGIKGKFIDAMQVGTPAVTTTIGAEAMRGDLDWNGAIADDFDLFADQAVLLYKNKDWWLQSQQNGISIINERYGRIKFAPLFMEKVQALALNLKEHRQRNFLGQILQHHMINSTKYMSLWIEEKNKAK
jgi:glycosyltransferase involved in cell wall biosynthesis